MRLDDERESDNVDDVRGQGGGGFNLGGGGFGGGGLIPMLLGFVVSRFGCGGVVVVGIVLLVLGMNPLSLLGGLGGGTVGGSGVGFPGPQTPVEQPQDATGPQGATTSAQDASARFVRRVLGTTEDTWNKILPEQANRRYVEPRLTLFSGQVQSGCGGATSASGPFYCPADSKVYLDATFFDELSSRFGAPGDFAAAYVIAHEIGHHIQNLLGVNQQTEPMMARASRAERNAISVRIELQADCLAGIWAKDNADILDPGDVEEATTAATAIGDDRLQRQSQGTVVPDSFTHGSSAQRVRWLQRGMAAGTLAACDTFAATEL